MSYLIDLWGQAMRSPFKCRECPWTGTGAQCVSGESFGDGVELDCPACGGRCGFAQYSIVAADSYKPGDPVERAPD